MAQRLKASHELQCARDELAERSKELQELRAESALVKAMLAISNDALHKATVNLEDIESFQRDFDALNTKARCMRSGLEAKKKMKGTTSTEHRGASLSQTNNNSNYYSGGAAANSNSGGGNDDDEDEDELSDKEGHDESNSETIMQPRHTISADEQITIRQCPSMDKENVKPSSTIN